MTPIDFQPNQLPADLRSVAQPHHHHNRGDSVIPTEPIANPASTSKSGRFATLGALLHAKGTGASIPRLILPVLAVLTSFVVMLGGLAFVSVLAFAVAPASAALTHEFVFSFNGAGEAPMALGSRLRGLAVDDSGGVTDGDVYVADLGNNVVDRFDASGRFLAQFTGAKTLAGSFAGPYGVAVNQFNGDLYVADSNHDVVDEFRASAGEEVEKAFGDEGQVSAAEIPAGKLGSVGVGEPFAPQGVAVDSGSGEVYVSDRGNSVIDVFSSTGGYLRQFACQGGCSGRSLLAFDSKTNNLFVAPLEGPTTVYVGSTGAPNAGFGGGTGVLYGGESIGVGVDPANDDVYITVRERVSGEEHPHILQYGETGVLLSNTASKDPSNTSNLEYGIGVGDAAGDIYTAGGASDVAVFTRALVLLPEAAEATNVRAGTATLNGVVDPEGQELVGCFFEYGETTAYGQLAACEEPGALEITGGEPVKVHAGISGLNPVTGYHFRLVAVTASGAGHGPDGVFITAGPPRVDGESVENVTSATATLGAKLNPEGIFATYRFEYLSEAQYKSNGGSFTGAQPAASAPIPAGGIYAGHADVGVSTAIGGLAPETTYLYRVVAGNSAAPGGVDGPVRVLVTHSASEETALPDGRVYELVSPSAKSGVGGVGGFVSVTADGSAIQYGGEGFFEPKGPFGPYFYTSILGPGGWSTRITTGEGPAEAFAPVAPPVAVSVPVLPGSVIAPGAQVVEGTPDGSMIFFLDEEQLTGDSTAAAGEPDLYRYDASTGQVTDLTVDATAGGHADVLGVIGSGGSSGEEGSYVYFVADGDLTGLAANGRGGRAQAGQPNLYVSHAGAVTFVATLSPQDSGVWEANPDARSAEVSGDGRYVAFGAVEELTGQPAEGVQLFRYDAVAGSLVCASCVSDGSASPAVVLSASAPGGYRRHYMADDGRVFFNAPGPVVARQDPNNVIVHVRRVDLFEFEDAGVGSCGVPGGCRLTIAAGGTGDSLLAGVSAEGNDVFFTTYQQLSSEDRDGVRDMYDARVGGRVPGEAPAGCESGGSCHEPVLQSLGAQIVGSATFTGPGNPPPPPGSVVKEAPRVKALTRAQLLARALRVCQRKPRGRRVSCKRTAHKRFGSGAKAKKSSRRSK
jgi:hypothetical protein